MRTRRILALILAAVLLVASLASCGSAYDNPTEYLTLPNYSTIQVKHADLVKKVEDQIKSIRTNAKGLVFEPLSGDDAVVRNGDQVRISFTGTTPANLSDSLKKYLKDENYYLTIGSENSFFPTDYTNKNNESKDDDSKELTVLTQGFEKQLIGLKAGESKTVTARFSNEHTEKDLRNVEITYEVKVISVARLTLTKTSNVTVNYTVTEKKEDVADILLPVITEEDKKEDDKPQTTAAGDDTSAADSTGDEAGEKEPSKSIEDLFPKKDNASMDLSSESTKFLSIFTHKDVAAYFEGKHLYDEFAVTLTIPEDLASSDYTGRLGQEIYVKFTVKNASVEPEWTDYFITKQTISAEDEKNRYTSTKAYEDYLYGEYKKSVAFDEIVKASDVTYPQKEWEELYKANLETQLCEFIKTKKNLTTTPSLADYTPKEIDEIVSEKEYQTLRLQASALAKESIKSRLTMEALFVQQNITLDKEKYNKRVDELKAEYEGMAWLYQAYYGIADFDAYLDAMYGGKDGLRLQIKYEDLLEKLPSLVTYEDKPAE